MKRINVTVYTDGSCLNNGAADAVGGWAAVLKTGKHRKELYGGELAAKNNRMELTAVIKAVEALTVPCALTVNTDSQYVIHTVATMRRWYVNGWQNPGGRVPANMDLIEHLRDAIIDGQHTIKVQHVPGHSGDPENERCDALAKAEARALQKLQVIA